jgi:16S rRNA (cytosine1402-N4)-methyltransferase
MVGMNEFYHTPVLLNDCIDLLDIKSEGIYVDLTFGGGGHSTAILNKLGPKGKLFGFDQDEDAKINVPQDQRFTLIPHNFRFIKNYLRVYGVNKVDGILGDLGVSSHQFDERERGFSIRHEAELDMRMNRKNPLTAKTIVNEYEPSDLKRIFREYGEIQNTPKLVRVLVEGRSNEEIVSTTQLMQVIDVCAPKFEKNKYFARVFQALRIEVNEEMDALKECLEQCPDLLNVGGRLVFISYHSLEDRLVKNLMKTGNTEGKEEKDVIYGTSEKIFKILTSKPIVPNEEEVKNNSRARSAKLRASEKI